MTIGAGAAETVFLPPQFYQFVANNLETGKHYIIEIFHFGQVDC